MASANTKTRARNKALAKFVLRIAYINTLLSCLLALAKVEKVFITIIVSSNK